MVHSRILALLAKTLRLFAGLAAAVLLLQVVGFLMYLQNAWPQIEANPPSGEAPSTAQTFAALLALTASWIRFLIWICIYWMGSKVFSLLHAEADTPQSAAGAAPLLGRLAWLLVASCLLDVLVLPAHFLAETFLPFPMSGWRLGLIEVARLIFPQAFGFTALILAFLCHEWRQMLTERSELKTDLELTV